MDSSVELKIDDKTLDTLTEKANRLVELLREAQQIIRSLSDKEESEF